MDIALVGPGRAGTAVALAARRAGHRIVSVSGRDPAAVAAAARLVSARPLRLEDPIDGADLVVVAVRDDAITQVASVLEVGGAGVVHLSGAEPVSALAPVAARGSETGSFHPLQSLPGAEQGAAALPGSWVAVTAGDDLGRRLFDLAASLGCTPFSLDDDAKPLYHAAAAAAANFPVLSLMMAEALFAAAGVPFAAAQPLVSTVVSNAFSMGPAAALTGPVARGDVGTVRRQLAAITAAAPDWEPAFRSAVLHTAAAIGRSDEFSEIVR